MYLRLNFSWKSKALTLRQPKLSAFYNKCSSNFSISECYFLNLKKLKHSWKRRWTFIRRGTDFSKISKKRGGGGGGEGCALRLVETFFQLQTGFQLLVQNKLFPSFSCHFFKNALQKPLFTIKYDKFILKIIEKTYKSVAASVSYISLNLNFHIPYKMLNDFFKFFLRHLFK